MARFVGIRPSVINSVWRDLRYGARRLSASPIQTLAAIFTLGIGVAVVTAVFSIAGTLLYAPLPYSHPNALVSIEEINQNGYRAVCMDDFIDWQTQSSVFQEMALSDRTEVTFSPRVSSALQMALRIPARRVSTEFFPVLGVKPKLGRWFLSSDQREVVLLSENFWRQQFGGKHDVVGQTVVLNDVDYTVVGVMPHTFRSWEQEPAGAVDVWMHLPLAAHGRLIHQYQAVARLKQGISLKTAQLQMSLIARRLQQQYPGTNTNWNVEVRPLQNEMAQAARPALWVLFIGACFVLLIACANVSGLLLVQTVARRKEVAVRQALGAQPSRILAQMLTESVLLSLIAGVLGLGAGIVLLQGISLLVPQSANLEWLFEVNATVIWLPAFAAVAGGMLSGVVPILYVWRLSPIQNLSHGTRAGELGKTETRYLGAFAICEVGLALLLLVGTGLFAKSFAKLLRVSPGFRTDNLLTMKFDVPSRACSERRECESFYPELLARLRTSPQIESVAAVDALPLSGIRAGWPLKIAGRQIPNDWASTMAIWYSATEEYFQAMGIPVLKGRPFTEDDTAHSEPVMIINNIAAERFWPGEDPIGKRASILDGPWRTIVGVVGDVKSNGLSGPQDAQVYVPFFQIPQAEMFVVVHTRGDPHRFASVVRAEALQLDKEVAVSRIETMADTLSRSIWRLKSAVLLISIFAGLAVVLAVTGLYGMLSYVVAKRNSEIGIRMALGATEGRIIWLVIRRGALLTAAGEALGIGMSVIFLRFVRNLLFGVEPTDWAVFAGSSFLLMIFALIACRAPAIHAARVDPAVAIRGE